MKNDFVLFVVRLSVVESFAPFVVKIVIPKTQNLLQPQAMPKFNVSYRY